MQELRREGWEREREGGGGVGGGGGERGIRMNHGGPSMGRVSLCYSIDLAEESAVPERVRMRGEKTFHSVGLRGGGGRSLFIAEVVVMVASSSDAGGGGVVVLVFITGGGIFFGDNAPVRYFRALTGPGRTSRGTADAGPRGFFGESLSQQFHQETEERKDEFYRPCAEFANSS